MAFRNQVTFRRLKKGSILGALHRNGEAAQPNFCKFKLVFVRQVTKNRGSYPWNMNCDFATVTSVTEATGSSAFTITQSAMFSYYTEYKKDWEVPA